MAHYGKVSEMIEYLQKMDGDEPIVMSLWMEEDYQSGVSGKRLDKEQTLQVMAATANNFDANMGINWEVIDITASELFGYANHPMIKVTLKSGVEFFMRSDSTDHARVAELANYHGIGRANYRAMDIASVLFSMDVEDETDPDEVL